LVIVPQHSEKDLPQLFLLDLFKDIIQKEEQHDLICKVLKLPKFLSPKKAS